MTMSLEELLEEKRRLEDKLRQYRKLAQGGDLAHDIENEEDDVACKDAWSTGNPKVRADDAAAAMPASVEELKQIATRSLQAGDYSAAVTGYTAAIAAANNQQLDSDTLAKLHSNRAHAHICNQKFQEAKVDAQLAAYLAPAWPKPLHRLAQALAGQRRWASAVAACRRGAAMLGQAPDACREFGALLDRIAIDAALRGDMAGFDGRHLEVRDAGEEAWLGREAPYNPDLDAEDDQQPPLLLMPPPASGDSHEQPAQMAGEACPPGTTLVPVGRGLSFRSLHAAVAAARDGDIITLRKGIHNGLGETVDVGRRVLIQGQGSLGETRYDMRGNSPALRLGACCVVRGLDIDMTGFREALKVEGARTARPHICDCLIRCSGDDAVDACGKASPLLSGCTLRARKCGVRAYDAAAVTLIGCRVAECGEQGVKAFDSATVALSRCQVAACEEDGVVAMGASAISMDECRITGCKGPAVDLTGAASLSAADCAFTDCLGAVWMWDDAEAAVSNSQMHADQTYVLLGSGNAKAQIEGCDIQGKPYATDSTQLAQWQAHNSITEPSKHVGVPPEDGAFEFVPNRFTRKQ